MANYAVQPISVAGTAVSYTAVSASDTLGDTSNGRTFLHVKNGGGSSDNVVIVTPGLYLGQSIGDITVTVANGTEKMIGPLDPNLVGATGATVTHSFTTTVTAALVSI